jgi:hypothetical protein
MDLMDLMDLMDASCFRTYFDATKKLPDLWFVAPGLVFLILGILLIRFRDNPFMARGPRWWSRTFPIFFFAFACLWTLLSTVGIVGQWLTARNSQAEVVEGTVENFHAMPFTGHDTEHFTVQGVRFDYSDYVVTPGFNQTSSHGGPIRPGLDVRIHYVILSGEGPTIVRLEIPCGT